MSEFIGILAKDALVELQQANKEVTTLVANIDKINQKIKSVSTPSGANNAIKDLSAEYQRQEKVIQSLQQKLQRASEQAVKNAERQRLAEIKLATDREKAFDKYDKALAREQAKLSASENLYNKVQAKMNALSNEYKILATRKELGLTLTAKEEQRYTSLQTRIQKYDTTLKAVDASMGKYGRNVANYASGFNPLNNSINQLGREMPAFANSVQTGFMAISNNLPIFFDAMQNVIQQNKELQAQGQPTKSVLSQLAGALFSFQTLLSVGVTLLTVYGKEIVNWVSSLWGASEALQELNKNQKEFNNAKFQGKKDAQSEIIELKKYLAVVKDVKVSDEERAIALKQLRSQFPFYFKNLTDAQILSGKYSDAEKELTKALEKRKDVEIKTGLNVSNRQKLLDIEKEKTQLLKDQEKVEKALESVRANVSSGAGRAATGLMEEQSRVRSRLNQLEKEYSFIQKNLISNENIIFKLKKETIGLEYQDKETKDKTAKSVEKLDLELQDYIASQYALIKAQKELNVESNKAIFDDENQTLENRLSAYERYVTGKIELENDAFEEEKRLLNLSTKNEIESLNEKYNDYIKQEGVTGSQRVSAKKELERALFALDEKSKADLGLLEVNHSKNIVEITKNTYDELRKIRALYFNLSENKRFQEMELRDLQQHQLRLTNITKNNTKNRIDEIDKLNEEAQKESAKRRLQLRVDEITKELDLVGLSAEKELKLRTELYLKLKEIAQLESADLEKKKQEQIAYLQLLEQTYGKFMDDFSNKSGFSGLIDILSGGLEKFKGDAVATALTVSEAFQQAFNTISEYSNANFQQMYSNLEQQRDVAILFAGESATAREAIEQQYEDRRRAIQRRQAEAQKRLAIFNIAVDTAQAIVAAVAASPLTGGLPFSAIAGAIGAAQIALVASQPIPAFEKGGIHDGGLMLVNDGKGSNYKETIVTPDGKVHKPQGKNVVMNAPKGTEIFTHDQWQDRLNNLLLSNGIEQSNSRTEVNPIINVETKDNYHFEVNEKGFKTFVTRGQAKTEILNARFRQQKRYV